MTTSPLLLGLCIAVDIFSVFAAGKTSLNIDCGDLTDKRTDELGIKWVGDGGYIKTGKTARVQPTGGYDQEFMTLRYFPSQKKSCYEIAGVVKGVKHMIRATFFYGNYDGKSSPPTFDLQFDGNYWDTITTSSEGSYFREVIYAPKRVNISVCVAQVWAGHVPFISALEVKEFVTGMYATDSTEAVLLLMSRIAFGSKDFVRYPDDPFDRYWRPSGEIDGAVTVERDDINNLGDNSIPGPALVHAITPASSNATTLTLPSSVLDLEVATYYYNFYFTEVLQAAYQNDGRSFDFLLDGSYTSHINHVGRNLTARSVISLVNTANASFPPILNAVEIFKVRQGLAGGTSENDVNTLKVLQDQYQQLQSWAGDPCLPQGSTWDWLNCSAEDSPRVTELYLSGSGLNGTLPDFSGLTALEIIDLSNNSLDGQIPDFLGRFPSLKELNLADNNFTGSLPASLEGNQKIKLDLAGNHINEIPPSSTDGGRKKKSIMVGVSVGSVVLLLLLVGV
ncbi:unnamed protein product [Victoria cruziana]